MTKIQANPGVLSIAPYSQGKSSVDGVENPIKLSSNESSHGPCPEALEAYRQAAGNLNRYPDGSQNELRRAIAETHRGLDPNYIVCGNGSEELIGLVVRAFLGTGDQALLSENGFVMSNIYCMAQGAELIIAPEKGYRVDVDALLQRVTEKTRFCTIANPNNPTGTYISGDELRRLHAGLPPECVLLVDNAYAEYVVADDFEDGSSLVNDFDNVVMTRTFSKIYGLPSLRIGWAYCSEPVLDALQRIRTPFNTNGPALKAAAAAIRQQDYVNTIRQHNHYWLGKMTSALTELGIDVIPSVANFYLMRFGRGKSGTEAAEFLQARGIIPRPAGGDDQYLRITVGLDSENEAVLAALTDYMNA